MARKKIPDKTIDSNFFEKLGSKAGVTVTICTLMTVSAAAGGWLTSIIKEQQIVTILTQNSKDVSIYSDQISDLKGQIRDLKFEKRQDSLRINTDGKSKK